ncbi:MAG: phosphoadenosine phosphosulfate reductase family protein [Methylococcaceae bacterium]|jgi:predicted phosphoadenosine phosphosulfate sulfurtransferase
MATQIYLNGQNVLDAARKRIAFIFDNFDNIHVSVSGGKDSTIIAHLALLEAHKRQRKIGLFFLDEEVVYQSTVEQIEYMMSMYPENTNRLWLQIPFYLTNATSLEESQLMCWEPGKHKHWMRPKGKGNIVAKPWDPAKEKFTSGYSWLDFYAVLENFQCCYTNTAFIVGLRGTESPNRWRIMTKNPVNIGGEDVYWATKKGENVTMYPIYDWNFHDVWRYIYDEKLKYSKIYDHQFMKGFSINEMRISSLIHEKSFKSLCELPEFEPKTYEKLCNRVKGIQFAQETGKSASMFKVRKLPKNFKSWIVYRDFLLDTYPNDTHREKFATRFARQLNNEFVARQQCRQLVLNDYENNLPVDNKPDPRTELISYYMENL